MIESAQEKVVQNYGARLSSLISTFAVKSGSIRVREQHLTTLTTRPRSIIIVGSSGAGKTTFVNEMRKLIEENPEYETLFEVPKRALTRKKRVGDDEGENVFPKNQTEFARVTRRGLTWKRNLEQVEKYGFTKPTKGKVQIYSANNALFDNEISVRPPYKGFFKSAIGVMVYKLDTEREASFRRRSPDVVADKPRETAIRMGDRAISQYRSSRVGVLIKNPDGDPERMKQNAEVLLRAVSELYKE